VSTSLRQEFVDASLEPSELCGNLVEWICRPAWHDSRRLADKSPNKRALATGPAKVEREDGTATDMEARFATEYSIDCLRHDLPDAIFGMTRSGSQVVAATAGGMVKRFTITGPNAVYSMTNPAPSQAFVVQQDQLFAVAAHLATDQIPAAGFTGEVVA